MIRRWAPWPVVLLLLLTTVLYGRGIGTTPAYIGGDEARFATAASSIASSGRDLAGNGLPLFFHMTESLGADAGTRWYQPTMFYLMALVFRFVPFNETTMRIPSVAVGILDVLLLYVVARRLFGSDAWASVAALMLALAPAHFIFSRQALDYICPLPFVLGWLGCLLVATERNSTMASAGAGFILGVGFYSYVAAWIMMPLLLVLTCAVQRLAGNTIRTSAGAVAGFAVPLLIVVPWLWSHPEMWRDTVLRYNVYDGRHLTPLQGVKDYLNYNNLQERLSVYWDYFNPAFLFFSGGSNLTMSTRHAGVLLWPVGVFLLCGLYDLWQAGRVEMSLLFMGGLALAPLPATFVDERYAIQRALFILPFAALIATFGAARLMRARRRSIQAVAVALILVTPVQYIYFYRDYFSDYRGRSAYWFDPANFRGIADDLIAMDETRHEPAMYFSEQLDDVAARWRFYLIKYRREPLLERSHLFGAGNLDLGQVPAGSLIVLYANDPAVAGLLAGDRCSVAAQITDIGGRPSAVILRKNG